MFEYSDMTDRQNEAQSRVPNYDMLNSKIRIGIRKSKLYSEPLKETKLLSMTGQLLNPEINNIYSIGVEKRDSDIRNVIRYNDVSRGYNPKNKITILESEIKVPMSDEARLKNAKTELKIMLELVEDPALQLTLTSHYKKTTTRSYFS